MPLKHACFISYRRYENNELAEALVSGLCTSLTYELDPLVGPNRAYRDDSGGMAPGSLLSPTLSRNICESACMVVVYGPDYFSRDNTWCAREFKAMLDLEEKRLQKVAESERVNGLLVIIVFRGRDSLPSVFLKNRLVSFFDKYALFQPEIPKHPDLYPEVMKIAAYVANRFNTLKAVADPCDEYNMPSEKEALDWLDNLAIKLAPADAFPR